MQSGRGECVRRQQPHQFIVVVVVVVAAPANGLSCLVVDPQLTRPFSRRRQEQVSSFYEHLFQPPPLSYIYGTAYYHRTSKAGELRTYLNYGQRSFKFSETRGQNTPSGPWHGGATNEKITVT